jgi:prepilin peptidase CpaA
MLPEALSSPAALETGIEILLAATLCYGCVADIGRLRIPNAVPLTVVALFFLNHWLRAAPDALAPHLWVGGSAFLLFLGLYLAGGFGAGDVKLIGALMLWAGARDGLDFLTVMAFTGGFIALGLLALRKAMAVWPGIKPYIPSRRLKAWARRRIFPYGVPICLAGLICIPLFFAP